MKKAALLYNVRSGHGHIADYTEPIRNIFAEYDYDLELLPIDFGTNPFDGRETLDLMVVAGGDGTINFAVNSMRRKGLDIPIGVIPAGTANDFAGALGMSFNLREAARQIASGREERVDCGCVNGRYFVNVCSFGLFTTTSQHTSDKHKHRMGKFAYLLEGSKELRNMHAIPLRVVADGKSFKCKVLMALIFNGETAGGFRLTHDSSIRDGKFDCLLLEKKNLFSSAYALLRYLLGGLPKGVRLLRVRTLELTSPIDEPTDIDGQPGASFPLRIECRPSMLRVRIPATTD